MHQSAFRPIVTVLIALVGALAAGSGAWAMPAAGVVRGELGRELHELLSGCADWGFSGSVLVVRDDEVVLREGYGLADRAPATPNTADTLFEIASVTKHFTAVAVLKLEEAGRLSTADPIAKWLPAVPAEHAGVTIDHLLGHSSGFPRMGPTGAGADTEVALRDYLAGGRVRAPGAGFEYWNGGYALLAMIIERASGQTYQAYCHEQLFAPAGMKSTGFCGETFDDRRLSHGYQDGFDVGPASSHSYGWEYRGMGGIVTSVADLERWDRALRAGRVLKATAKMQTPGDTGYGGGGWVERSDRDTTVITHVGNVRGYECTLWRYPDERCLISVLCNTSHHAVMMSMHLNQRLFDLPGLLPPAPRRAEIDDAQAEALCGTYRAEDGSVVELRREGDRVLVMATGQPAIQMLMYGDPAIPDAVLVKVEAAEQILRSVIDGSGELIRVTMNPEIPADWPERLLAHWKATVGPRGAVTAVELVGAKPTSRSPSSVEVTFRLRQAAGETVVTLGIDMGRLQTFLTDAIFVPYTLRYAPTSPTTLASYELSPGRPPAIEVDVATGRLVIRGNADRSLAFERAATDAP
ncbi:MAG: serine hydrolase domain-containing protein [Planctomycetota bacterium]|jgi:CubicO group peptidase (beta-lactamase class C family)